MRRTRILATLGPASSDQTIISELLAAGADGFRLNFSHGSIDTHRRVCERVRQAAAAAGRHVAILQDLGGPKIRTGPVAAAITLSEGDTLTIELGDFVGEPGRVACSFDALFTSVQPGQHLLVDDGRIELEVTAVAPGRLTCRIINGGVLESHKGVNLPNAALRTSALTPKDAEDLRAGVQMGVDLVALSFVQSADDVRAARAAAVAAGAPDLPIIAKIEKPQAVEHLDEILDASDGLIVARGDLGIELPLERVPAVQKQVIVAARRRGVPVIVATQVLESMRVELRPTRAEVTDAAHAVDEGTDAILLTSETAIGHYPVRVVEMLDRIVNEAERVFEASSSRLLPDNASWSEHSRALCEAAVALAARARASAIVAVTEAGTTARMLAALRPPAAILAITTSAQTAARLSLVWGVASVVTDATALDDIRALLLERAMVPVGGVVVFVAIRPMLGKDNRNFVHVERL